MTNEKNFNQDRSEKIPRKEKTPLKKEVGRWESEGGQPLPPEKERPRTDQDPNEGLNQDRKNPMRFGRDRH